MKTSLLGHIAQISRDRTGISGQAPAGMAFGLRVLQQKTGTTIYIVTVVINSLDRANMQAGLAVAIEAGRFGQNRFPGDGEFGSQQRKPIRMPQSELGVHHHAER